MAEVYEHPFFASIDWEGLLAMEVRPPFEPDMDTTPPARQQIPKAYEGSELDYFCQARPPIPPARPPAPPHPSPLCLTGRPALLTRWSTT